jgi:hypothetical protein
MTPKTPARLACAVALGAVLVLGACGDDDQSTTADTGADQPLGSSDGDGSSRPAASGPAGPCEAPDQPPGTPSRGEMEADVDGDGEPDTIRLYQGGDPTPYKLRVELGNSRGAVETIVTGPEGGDPAEAPSLLGGADISPDDDGTGDEIALVLGRGAATTLVGFYQLTDCELLPLRRQGEANVAELAVGGSATDLSGLRCETGPDGPLVVEVTGQSSDGTTYATTEQSWQVAAGELVAMGEPTPVAGDEPPEATLDCFDLRL